MHTLNTRLKHFCNSARAASRSSEIRVTLSIHEYRMVGELVRQNGFRSLPWHGPRIRARMNVREIAECDFAPERIFLPRRGRSPVAIARRDFDYLQAAIVRSVTLLNKRAIFSSFTFFLELLCYLFCRVQYRGERRSDRYKRLSTFCIFHAAGHSTICRSKSYYVMSTDLVYNVCCRTS